MPMEVDGTREGPSVKDFGLGVNDMKNFTRFKRCMSRNKCRRKINGLIY